MILTQTTALLVDAYRELNSKRLFWITMVLSGLIVMVFACLGINKEGVTLLHWQLGSFGGFATSDLLPPDQLYKTMFANFGIAFWLSWIATILALVSTSSLIPDFIASGAVELTLSKPVSRIRLFLTKFVMGLLFVTLQVSVFCVASFLVIGIRGGSWEPGVFLAIPVVVVFFSYLFSVCALLGLLTRSTIASLLLTLLFWFLCFLVNTVEGMSLMGRESNIVQRESLVARMERMEKSTTDQYYKSKTVEGEPPPPPPTKADLDALNRFLPDARARIASIDEAQPKWDLAAQAMVTFKTVIPKTSETVSLMDRWLVKSMSIGPREEQESEENARVPEGGPAFVRLSPAEERKMQERLVEVYKGRSVWWVIGTSLIFEGVILAFACWRFARRDF